MMHRRWILTATVLLAACGGGEEGTAVSSSPLPPPVDGAPAQGTPGAATPAPAPEPPAGPAPAPESPAATPPAAPVSSDRIYGPRQLDCMQGEPMYWARDWTVSYNGTGTGTAVLDFQVADATSQSFVLPRQGLTETPYPDGTTFTGTTAEGRVVWITVTAADGIVGAGHVGSEPGDQLRCGVSMAGVAVTEALTQTNLVCGTYVGDVNAVPGGAWILDARAYPWTSLLAEHVETEPVWQVTTGADARSVTVNVYNGGQNTGSIYELRDGRLVSYSSPRSRNGGPPRVCWAP